VDISNESVRVTGRSFETLHDRDALREFQGMADALPCIVWIADRDGHVEWTNHEFGEYTGSRLKAAADADWMPFVHPEDAQRVAQAWTSMLASKAKLDSILRLRNAAGEFRWFRLQARRSSGESGARSKWYGTLTDVHERQIAFNANSHVVDALMKGYLAKRFPVVEGLRFDSLYRAANTLEKLGGDWYDTFVLPDGRVGFSLGDVCGHGVDAAVKMGEAKQAIFVAACLDESTPVRVLERANEVLFLNNHHVSITTAIYGVIDTKRRTVTYASAGHHPPILARPHQPAEVLPNHGFPLGVEEKMPPLLREHGISYASGDTIVVYTDGLIEFNHDIFDGESRLLVAAADSVRLNAEYPASYIGNHVLGDTTPSDDVAVLTISFHD